MKRFSLITIAALLFASTAFCYTAVIDRLALGNWNDLTTPSTAQNYQLGEKVNILDTNSKSQSTWEYVRASIALSAGGVYVIISSGTAGNEVTVIKSVGNQPPLTACVPPVAFTAGQYGWVQIQGLCSVANYGTTTAGDLAYLKIGTTYFYDAATTVYSTTVATNTYAGNFVARQTVDVTTATFYLNGTPQCSW